MLVAAPRPPRLPAIQAQLALDKKNPAAALNTLQAASPIELGTMQFVTNISCVYLVENLLKLGGNATLSGCQVCFSAFIRWFLLPASALLFVVCFFVVLQRVNRYSLTPGKFALSSI